MKFLKTLLFFLLIVIVAGIGVVWAKNKGYLKNTPLDKITIQDVKFLGQDSKEQAQIFSDRAKQTSGQVQQVLGESIQINQSTDKPIHQQTFEYARYLYCQQVVKDWESRPAASEAATPAGAETPTATETFTATETPTP